MKQKFPFFFYLLFGFNCLIAQDTIRSLQLISGDKTRIISQKGVISVYTIDNESIHGEFLYKNGQHISLKPYSKSDQTKYKLFSSNTDSTIQISINSIEMLYRERSSLSTAAALTTWGSVITAFIISPLLSLEKGGGFDTKKCLTISGISLGGTILSAGIIILFSDQKFMLKPKKDNKRIWTIK